MPSEVPTATVHVLGRRLEGTFEKTLTNLNPEIDLPGGVLTWGLEVILEAALAVLIAPVTTVVGAIQRGTTTRELTPFEFQGTWVVIKSIYQFLVNKELTVKLDVKASFPGYELPSFIVDPLSKAFVSEVRIPARYVRWSAL